MSSREHLEELIDRRNRYVLQAQRLENGLKERIGRLHRKIKAIDEEIAEADNHS
jgi:hypothetical protein